MRILTDYFGLNSLWSFKGWA